MKDPIEALFYFMGLTLFAFSIPEPKGKLAYA